MARLAACQNNLSVFAQPQASCIPAMPHPAPSVIMHATQHALPQISWTGPLKVKRCVDLHAFEWLLTSQALYNAPYTGGHPPQWLQHLGVLRTGGLSRWHGTCRSEPPYHHHIVDHSLWCPCCHYSVLSPCWFGTIPAQLMEAPCDHAWNLLVAAIC